MNEHGITKENLLAALPQVLQTDASTAALAQAAAGVLAERRSETDRLLLYPAIDTLEEPLLDILAQDFKVDWWDPNYTLEEKRRTLKDSWKVHRRLGTKAAVETAISAIYRDTQVAEWFEYGGEAYHFRLRVDVTYENVDPEKHRRVMERVNIYKNLRSVLDEIEYYDFGGTAEVWAAAGCAGCAVVDGAAAERY